MNEKWIFGIIGAITLVGLGIFVYTQSKPLPELGQKFEDLGREHIQIGEKAEYNSNPPTSGNHYSDWTRTLVSDVVKDDRNLLHSMEHGYVIMWYKCPGIGPSLLDQPSESSPSANPDTNNCQDKKDRLATIYQNKGQRKLIVAPRENLDTEYAVTAWTRMDTFNDFDSKKVEQFIDAYRDQGPEKTME